MTCEGQSSNFILLNHDDDNYIKNEAAANLLCMKSERIEKKRLDLTSLLPSNDNFTMHESASNVFMPSASFLLDDGTSNLTKPYEKNSPKKNPYPPEIRIVKLEEKQWMCDVCKNATFNNFVEACMHEITCKLPVEDDTFRKYTPPILSELVTNQEKELPNGANRMKVTIPTIKTIKDLSEINVIKKVVNISLTPRNKNILSGYNFLLTQHIELFEVTTKPNFSQGSLNINLMTLPMSKVGLRCKHCIDTKCHITAASFFPTSIKSIASGLGTIGARHFAGEKCPLVSEETLELLKHAKRISQQQTRTQGRIGLDAYCRVLANKKHIVNHDSGGIYILTNPNRYVKVKDRENNLPKKRTEDISDKYLFLNKIDSISKRKNEIDLSLTCEKEKSPFIQGNIEHFWECENCNMLPFPWRATGSVVFSRTFPSLGTVDKHLEICQGKKPMRIPRNAVIESKREENGNSVHVRWQKNGLRIKKTDRICDDILKENDKPLGIITEGVENQPLALSSDKELTTEFAHFTVLQLRKCYLTKSGGSRGNCPVGYPGLACLHCVGTANERRFFYTSSDHLRNSFSHIPAHLAVCSKCPDNVRNSIEDFKEKRSIQKSHLKTGNHKQFINIVWERLHGSRGGIIYANCEREEDGYESTTESKSVSSISIDTECESDNYRAQSSDGRWLENSDIAIDSKTSSFVYPTDRQLTTDYTFFSLLQLTPYIPVATKNTEIPLNDSSKVVKNMEVEEETNKIGNHETAGLACKYCMGESTRGTFLYNSPDELRSAFAEIPKHLLFCASCPQDVQTKLNKFKALRSSQEACLKYESHKALMDEVWERLRITDKNYNSNDKSCETKTTNSLVCDEDRCLVTDFTFFTMEQMVSCSLEHSGNGARSMFEYGFPGLACAHCEGTPSARKFFYRTFEILSGNYAHIPNHLMSCKHCPLHIKAALEQKKKNHAANKSLLTRGTQRAFFKKLWERLHSKEGHRKGIAIQSLSK